VPLIATAQNFADFRKGTERVLARAAVCAIFGGGFGAGRPGSRGFGKVGPEEERIEAEFFALDLPVLAHVGTLGSISVSCCCANPPPARVARGRIFRKTGRQWVFNLTGCGLLDTVRKHC